MALPTPPRRPQLPYGGEDEERTPVLDVPTRLAKLEYEFCKFIEISKGLIEAVRGPENEPDKGLLSIVAAHDKRHRLFDYIVRSVLVAIALGALAVLGKIAVMVQSARWAP